MPDQANKMNNRILLIALAPSSGIAFFESKEQVFEIDMRSGEVEKHEEDLAFYSMSMEHGLKPVGIEFNTEEDLKEYVRTEYLREEKYSHYMLLLTEELDRSLRREVIDLLNSENFTQIDFSPEMVKNLTSRALEHPQTFVQLLREVDEIKATNVQHCLELFADVVLVGEALRGNLEAFDELMKKYQRSIRRLIYYKIRNIGKAEDAEDLVQETFMRAFSRLQTLGNWSKFGNWLWIIASNTAASFHRRMKRLPSHQPIQELPDMAALDQLQPDDEIERIEAYEEVLREIDRLPPRQKQVIVKCLEGLDSKEIAEIMGCSIATVYSLRRHALNKLRIGIDFSTIDGSLMNKENNGGKSYDEFQNSDGALPK